MPELTLGAGQFTIDRQSTLGYQIINDCFAVADDLTVIDYVRKLGTRRTRCIEDMLMNERELGQSEERKHFQTITVVIGDSTQFRVRIQGEHCRIRSVTSRQKERRV